MKSYDDLVPLVTEQKLANAIQVAQELETMAAEMDNTPGNVALLYFKRKIVTFLPSEFSAIVQEVLSEGFSIASPINDKTTIIQGGAPGGNNWGFDNAKLLQEAEAIKHEDEQLLDDLRYGCADRSCSTPPISIFIPPSPSAMLEATKFSAKMTEEIQKGWFGPATKRLATLPFVNPPGGLVPKKSSYKLKLIWNASSPRPAQRFEVVTINGEDVLVSANFNTILPKDIRFMDIYGRYQSHISRPRTGRESQKL